MLKLTRHLFEWEPDARLFDFYERVQLNHIMAHQRPDTGQFVYFMPLESSSRRSYSTAEESFWCCVGTGMESHSKHADSIYWHDGRSLIVNLYIPSRLDWPERGFALEMATGMPFAGDATLTIERAPRGLATIALRLPGWAAEPGIKVNGKDAAWKAERSYAHITRLWRAGDIVAVHLPMVLASHATPDDASLRAFTHGPLVLAADMGPADATFGDIGPALFDAAPPKRAGGMGNATVYKAQSTLGEALQLSPFFRQYDRRTAVYFPNFTACEWNAQKESYLKAQDVHRDLAWRTVDVMFLGEMQPERDHQFKASNAPTVQLHGRSARKLKVGEHFEVTMAQRAGPAAVLQIVYWGWDADSKLDISVDGKLMAHAQRQNRRQDKFITIDYPLAGDPAAGDGKVVVRLDGIEGDTDVYEIRMMEAPVSAITI